MHEKDSRIIYITGVGRSGTTLIQSMLHAHSKVHLPPETHFFKRYILPFVLKRKLVDTEAIREDRFFQRLPVETRERLLKLPLLDLKGYLFFFKTLMSGKESSAYIGDKDTEYVRYIPHLAKLFPTAVLLNIHRDPRDVVSSRLKADWGKKSSFAFHAAEYQYYIKKVAQDGRKYFGERFIQIRYEDLIQQPQEELKALCLKLGLKFEPEMLDFHTMSKQLIGKEEGQWKENVAKPVQAANMGKWKKSLSPQQALALQKGIEDYYISGQYELLQGAPPFILYLKILFFKRIFALKTFKEKIG